LVALPGLTKRSTPRRLRALGRAIDLAAVAVGADRHHDAAPLAREETVVESHRQPGAAEGLDADPPPGGYSQRSDPPRAVSLQGPWVTAKSLPRARPFAAGCILPHDLPAFPPSPTPGGDDVAQVVEEDGGRVRYQPTMRGFSPPATPPTRRAGSAGRPGRPGGAARRNPANSD
jgi:hypothetical protein